MDHTATWRASQLVIAARREGDTDIELRCMKKCVHYVTDSSGTGKTHLALALGLAMVGLYSVKTYAVIRRTREIGIRMALGARRGDVVGMIVRESLVPVLIGMAIGLAAAVALTRLVAGLLFGVAPRDPASMLIAAAAMLTVALLAAAIPARRCFSPTARRWRRSSLGLQGPSAASAAAA